MLLDHNATVDMRAENGQTALHLATTQGSLEVMEALLVHGASTDLEDHIKLYTPLHLTAGFGKPDAARLLLSFAAGTARANPRAGHSCVYPALTPRGWGSRQVSLPRMRPGR